MIDCREFDDPDSDKSLRKHSGRNLRITKSIMESKNYHELHSRLCGKMFGMQRTVYHSCPDTLRPRPS